MAAETSLICSEIFPGFFHGQLGDHGKKLEKQQKTSIFYNNKVFYGDLADHGKGVSPKKTHAFGCSADLRKNS